MCPGEVKHSDRQQSLDEGSHEGFGSMFNETEQTMILYQTFECVEEMKVANDDLLQYVHDKISEITDDVKIQKENIKSIENTIEIQNKKIERIDSTLSEILSILKVDKEKE